MTEIYTKKRDDYLEWNDYFMCIAFLSAMRSKDPNTQVGACIVNDENKIVGVGYNGLPIGCKDEDFPWNSRSENWLETKDPYMCCAELNAVLNKNSSDIDGCRVYVTLFPCNKCAKVLIQCGIKEVIYWSDKYHDEEYMVASRYLFNLAGVKITKFVPKVEKVFIDIMKLK